MGTYWGADGKTVDGRFELAGSNVEVVWQSAAALTTTTALYLPPLNVSDCSDFYIIIESSLNQNIEFFIDRVNGHGTAGFPLKDNSDTVIGKTPIAVGTNAFVLKFAQLPHAVSIQGYVRAIVAPTTGSVSIYVVKRGKI